MKEIAKEIARKAHEGMSDRGGVDYFKGHLTYVASLCEGEIIKAVGYLHDSIEDTEYTKETLFSEMVEKGVSREDASTIVCAVEAITKKESEEYVEYLERVRDNAIARKVKLIDLEHNSDTSRIKKISEKDISRTTKYKKSIEYLKS